MARFSGRKVTEHKICIFIFATTLSGTRYSCQILIKLEFSREIFDKSPNIRFPLKNPASGSRGQTDGHDEANSSFSQFCERA
jgi:hypothetical protein